MRIVFFGSSHGVPEANRRCSSAMIEVGERRYFIDMGTQSIEQLITRRMAPNSVKGIFFTHMHGDHTNGLISFVDLCTWYFKDVDPAIYLPEPVEDTVAALSAWLKCNGIAQMKPFRFAPVHEGVLYEDEAIKVTAFRTKHNQMSHAYLVEAEGKRVLFTGDLRHPTVDFPQVVNEEEIDLVIVESAHFSSDATEAALENAKVKRVLHNHISPAWDEDLARMAKRAHHYQYGKAYDGMEVVL